MNPTSKRRYTHTHTHTHNTHTHNVFEGRETWTKYFFIFLKRSLGCSNHMKKISDFSWLSSLSNFILNFVFLLPVCVEIQNLLWGVDSHTSSRECQLEHHAYSLCGCCMFHEHCDSVSLFRFPRYPCLREKWVKHVQRTQVHWNPTDNSVLCSKHFEEDCFEPGRMLELVVRYKWQVMPPNTHCSLFPISHSWVYSVLRHVTWKFRSYVDVQHIELLLHYLVHPFISWCIN